MKFHEFLEKVPNFWETVAGYPAAVQSQINDWFYYRVCCTNDTTKFARYLSRKLNLVQPQFNNLWEKEGLLNFEPGQLEKVEQTINLTKTEGVVEAIKKILNGTVKDTGTTTNATAITGTDTNKEERNLSNIDKSTGTEKRAVNDTQTNNTNETLTRTGTEKTDITSTRTDDLTATMDGETSDTGTVTNESTVNTTASRKVSDYPQSSPNSGFENYLTSQVEDTTNETRSNTETRNLASTNNETRKNTGTVANVEAHTLTLDTTQTNSNTGTIGKVTDDTLTLDTTRTNTSTGNVTDTLTRNTNSDTTLTLDTTQATNTNENVDRTNDLNAKADTVINTLRTGNLEEAFEKYFRMATSFNAVSWLIGQLDEVFIQIYDYEDFCESDSTVISKEIEELKKQIATLQIEVDATMDYAESIHDDLQNTITTVSKHTADIRTVTQVASENSTELATQAQSIDNMINKAVVFDNLVIPIRVVPRNGNPVIINKPITSIGTISITPDNKINRMVLMIPGNINLYPEYDGDIRYVELQSFKVSGLPAQLRPWSSKKWTILISAYSDNSDFGEYILTNEISVDRFELTATIIGDKSEIEFYPKYVGKQKLYSPTSSSYRWDYGNILGDNYIEVY